MNMSTAGLGRELGLNSQETNILLRDEGYQKGEPGDWTLTEKGREHATQLVAPNNSGKGKSAKQSWRTEVTKMPMIATAMDRTVTKMP